MLGPHPAIDHHDYANVSKRLLPDRHRLDSPVATHSPSLRRPRLPAGRSSCARIKLRIKLWIKFRSGSHDNRPDCPRASTFAFRHGLTAAEPNRALPHNLCELFGLVCDYRLVVVPLWLLSKVPVLDHIRSWQQ